MSIVERLEQRMMLVFGPAGAELPVNTFTAGSQALPAIAVDAEGDFVVVWETEGEGASLVNDIYARRYDSSGIPQGAGPFRVNTYTTNNQHRPAVAMDADGDFVIAWESQGQDGSADGIYAQRFNAVGVPQGNEFRVNTYTTLNQWDPAVACDPSGNFVITWLSQNQTGDSGYGIYAQRYNAVGAAQGSEFHVNTHTPDQQSWPTVAMSGSGSFVIAWNSMDGSGLGVYAKRYNAAGVSQVPPAGVVLGAGNEFRVNVTTLSNQYLPAVAMDYSGKFVVTWTAAEGPSTGIVGRRYSADGIPNPPNADFSLNGISAGEQAHSTVAMDADGDFAVAWHSPDADGVGSYYRRFDSLFVPQEAIEQQVNTFTTGNQLLAAIGMSGDRDFVVAWQSETQDGSGAGVYAQRYNETDDSSSPVVGGVFLSGQRVLADSLHQTSSQITVAFSEQVSTLGGAAGQNSVLNPANWMLTHNGTDVTSSISSINSGIQNGRYEALLNLSGALPHGNITVTAKETITGSSGAPLDGNYDGSNGGDFVLPFVIGTSGYRVIALPKESPQDGGFSIVFDPADPVASPFGWHDTNGVAGAEFSDTRGNNTDTYLDRVGNNTPGAPRPDGGANLDFTGFTFDPSQEPITAQNQIAAQVNLFYVTNTLHDILYKFGFTEANRNFQLNNYGRGGLGNDHVRAEAQDASTTNNAFFFAPADGSAPRMQMGLFTTSTPQRDAALDNQVIVYSYGYGMMARLVGNGSGLVARQSGGMQNGWSDWLAIMLTQKPSDVQSGAYPLGTYVLGQPSNGPGIRAFPYSFDILVDPLTIADYNTNQLVHYAGSIWASALWDLNWLLINKYGFEPNLGNGFNPAQVRGNALALQLVLDAARTATPNNPSFSQARDAILQADMNLHNALGTPLNQLEIWQAFARRGMGVGFSTAHSDSTTVTPSFVAPTAPQVSASAFLFETLPLKLTLTFNQDVSASLSLADITVQDLTHGTIVTPSGLTYESGTNTATVTFAGSLADADYRATLNAPGITNSMGIPIAANHSLDFFVLAGDADRDRDVDINDLGILATNWQQSPRMFSLGDFDYNGTVDVNDLGILATKWQQQLAAPSAPASLGSTRRSEVSRVAAEVLR